MKYVYFVKFNTKEIYLIYIYDMMAIIFQIKKNNVYFDILYYYKVKNVLYFYQSVVYSY